MLRLTRIAFTAAFSTVAIVVGAPAMAAQPSGPKLVPFHATYTGTYQAAVVPPNVIITATAEGHASHLGRSTANVSIAVSLARTDVPNCPVPGTTEVYTATITAANGDTITLVGTGYGCQTSPTTVSVVDEITVTGGTGRFEGASGSLIGRTAVDQPSGTESFTLDGTLSTPGSIR